MGCDKAMSNLVHKIEQADEAEIKVFLKVVLRRYAVLFPDWEVSIFSLYKGSDRNEQFDRMIELLQKMKDSP